MCQYSMFHDLICHSGPVLLDRPEAEAEHFHMYSHARGSSIRERADPAEIPP